VRKAAAVIIGVNKTGGLDPLKSPARGAEEVAHWLKTEGFDVELLTDKDGTPVTATAVKESIKKFATKPPTCELLVVYFSGHGQWHTRSDHWLLSGAPEDIAEAINLEGAMYTARWCGVPNVVFISDACRSIPTGQRDSLVNGVDAFPNHGSPSISKIDFFKATSEARPAYEIPIGGTDQSVLTRAILSAFESPEPQIVKQVEDGNQKVSVIPNRLLESVLQARVDAILDGIDGSPIQNLDTNVPSADTVYIARVRPVPSAPTAPAMPPAPPPGAPPRVRGRGTAGAPRRRPSRQIPGRAAAEAISETLRGAPSRAAPAGVNREEIEARTPDSTADHFETETGFIIRGARVAAAAINPRYNSGFDLLKNPNDPRGEAVRITPGAPAFSVVVVLEDERSVALAALRGYLGHVQFDEEGAVNVSYVPSSNSRRFPAYQARRADIDRLRSLVAVAVQRSTFRVRSELDAIQLADRIRVEKALDPTLGVYAAYAFAQAGMDAQVRDLLAYMRDDLEADIFDVAMLSNEMQRRGRNRPLAPMCPMLTQGWNLLRAYDVKLPGVLGEASRFLCNSLWSTFTSRGTRLVFDAVTSGELE
jgi:hypothetical protein